MQTLNSEHCVLNVGRTVG